MCLNDKLPKCNPFPKSSKFIYFRYSVLDANMLQLGFKIRQIKIMINTVTYYRLTLGHNKQF